MLRYMYSACLVVTESYNQHFAERLVFIKTLLGLHNNAHEEYTVSYAIQAPFIFETFCVFGHSLRECDIFIQLGMLFNTAYRG
jgi:hypothetical protein